jgi:DNA-directed RNA polymerase subunit alpha
VAPEILAKTVADLELSVRSRKALQRLNINTVGELVSRTEDELLGCKNFGQTSLNEIKQQLTTFSIGLRKLDE